jgi:iron complex transport system permease protein
VLVAARYVKSLNGLLLGEEYAESMGIPVAQIRRICLLVATLLTGAVTAYCGPIAFLGLLVPHVARWLFRTADHRVLLPGTVLAGMCFALGGDWIVNLPWSRHFLHLSAVNGLMGAPLVLAMLIKHKSFRGLDS